MGLDDGKCWLLEIVGSTPYVEGRTRLQKYGFLASKIILADAAPYTDWKPYHFGAHSSCLDSDTTFLVQEGLVDAQEVDSRYGTHNRYSISREGRRAAQQFKADAALAGKITQLTGHYFDRPLDELLADAYALFPEYTIKSRIKARVRRNILTRDASLGSKIALPYTDRKIGITSITSSAMINPFPYNDEDLRKELAKQAGLSGVPPIDPGAYDELSEVFADKKFLTYEDVEEIIDNIRA